MGATFDIFYYYPKCGSLPREKNEYTIEGAFFNPKDEQYVLDLMRNHGQVTISESFEQLRPSNTQFIFSGPCTIMIETYPDYRSMDRAYYQVKTIVRCQEGDVYAWEKGAFAVLAKRVLSKKQWNAILDLKSPCGDHWIFEAIAVEHLGKKKVDELMTKAMAAYHKSKED